jgi:hypothetical protein
VVVAQEVVVVLVAENKNPVIHSTAEIG